MNVPKKFLKLSETYLNTAPISEHTSRETESLGKQSFWSSPKSQGDQKISVYPRRNKHVRQLLCFRGACEKLGQKVCLFIQSMRHGVCETFEGKRSVHVHVMGQLAIKIHNRHMYRCAVSIGHQSGWQSTRGRCGSPRNKTHEIPVHFAV